MEEQGADSITPAQADHLIEKWIRVGSSDAVEHKPLPPEDQRFNSHLRIRQAGYTDEGDYLGDEISDRDARIIDLLHAPHLVLPDQIRDQMAKFALLLQQCGGDWHDIPPDQYEGFMELGGHIPLQGLSELLPALCRGTDLKSYAMLTEWVPDGAKSADIQRRVPFAYHFGFTQMPKSDPRFPSLDAGDIAGNFGKWAEDHAEEIWAPWRVGVLRSMDDRTMQAMRDMDIEVPDDLAGVKGTRRGINALQKIVYASMAACLGSGQITYNTASIAPPGQIVLGSMSGHAMPNAALQKSNAPLFGRDPTSVRNHTDSILDANGEPVAQTEWLVFSRPPLDVLRAALSEDGVVSEKGGYGDLRLFREAGDLGTDIIARRQGIRRLLRSSDLSV